MSAQVAIYISAFMGMTALMTLFGCLIYRRHRKMVDQYRAYERMAQERIQQARDENLPPFYIDHVRDRACVFEGELPPENYPRALEVVVVRPRREGSLEDLVPAGTTTGGTTAEGATGIDGQSSEAGGRQHHSRNPSSSMSLPDLIVSGLPQLGTPVVESGVIRPSPSSFVRRPMRAVTTNINNTPSPFAAAVLLPPIPTLAVTVHDDDININETDGQESIQTLPPPPSYDITPHVSPEQDIIVRHVSAPPATGDYFSHHSNHQHTHSLHLNNNNSQTQQHQQQPHLHTSSPQTSIPPPVVIEPTSTATAVPSPAPSPTPSPTPSPASSPIETPRYSDEFPSHIPHEQHLEGYRRARALSDVSLQHPQQQQEFSSLSAIATPATTVPAEALSSSYLSSARS